MPRDASGFFDYDFVFVDDATGTPKVPFDPARFDAKFADVKSGLNDIPRAVPAGTDPNTVLPPAIMLEDGVVYVCVLNGDSGYNIWQDISTPGITDSAGFISDSQLTDAINALLGDAPGNLNTLGKLSDAVGDDSNFATTIATQLDLKAAVNHTHEIENINGLEAALQAAAMHPVTTGTWLAYHTANAPLIDLGNLTASGDFTDELFATNRMSLAEGSSTIDLGSAT